MFSLFNKFKKGLKKTSKKLFGSARALFGFKELDEASIDEIEEALYMADFGVETTTEIINAIKDAYKREKKLHGQQAAELAATILERILVGACPPEPIFEKDKLQIISLLGVNGVGKTTSAGKLAHNLQEAGYRLLMGACDTFRAAANEQINLWSERVKVEIIKSHHGADAAAVAFDALEAAKNRNKEILILDTAGRLHTQTPLMEELAKIKRVLNKQAEGIPQHSWLVVDGSLGSNSITQAKIFHEAFGLTGIIVTKLDGTSRGGALVGIYRELKLPIYYVGLGEGENDLQRFSPKEYIHALFASEEDNA